VRNSSNDSRAAGLWLRQLRDAAGLTQEQLADRSGLSVRAISNLERGRTRRPYPHTLQLVTRSLGLEEGAEGELLARYRDNHRRSGLRLVSAQEAGFPPAASEDSTARGLGKPAAVPQQLPGAVPCFSGRAAEVALLDEWLKRAAGGGTERAAAISVISGVAGIGKTALAVYWAHRVADQFPDGQLYVNLRGYDTGGQPADAAEVVRGFLLALGVAPEQIPSSLDGQTALYRSVLAGRRILIVADNARNAAQVRPLLPGTPGNVVLVTSRGNLGGLVAAEGARTFRLNVPDEADAAELLSARLGPDRVAAEPEAVAGLIRLCARLPLALAIVAARAELTAQPLAVLARRLADAEERLGFLGLGDPGTDVRAVFSWSLRQVSGESARMFRLLAVHPGPDITVPAAASLARVPVHQAQCYLSELADAGMVEEGAPRRYLLHDLLRAYAAEQVGPADTDPEYEAAVRGMLDYYLLTALAAAHALDPTEPAATQLPAPGATREAIAGSDEALDWFSAEYHVLLAVIAQAARAGCDDAARRIAWALEPFFERTRNWPELAITQQAALNCSSRIGDRAGQATSHLYLGRALAHQGHARSALSHLKKAAELSHVLGDRSAEARAHLAFSVLWLGKSDLASSISSSLQALQLAEAHGDLALMAHACNNLGYSYAVQNDTDQALAYCRRALELCSRVDAPCIEAHAADSLGYTYCCLGDQRQAAVSYRRAAALFQDTGARYLSAQSLTSLGDSHKAAGHLSAARSAWRRALTILDDLNHPDADQIRRKLGNPDSNSFRPAACR
jgi:transcriptional regulator with XRE-family HTH domain/tetratricopeptide (TPR) repeat protein